MAHGGPRAVSANLPGARLHPRFGTLIEVVRKIFKEDLEARHRFIERCSALIRRVVVKYVPAECVSSDIHGTNRVPIQEGHSRNAGQPDQLLLSLLSLSRGVCEEPG